MSQLESKNTQMQNNYLNQVSTVTIWEFKRFFKWKQEIMSYGIMLLIIAGISLWQSHIADNDNTIHVAVSDELSLPAHDRFSVRPFSIDDLSSVQQAVGEKYQGIVYFENDELVIFVSQKDKWQQNFRQWISSVAQSQKLDEAGITGEQLQKIINPYRFKLLVKGEDENKGDKSNAALLTMILLMVGVFTAFAYAFASITTEKTQRVTEQLLSTMSAQTWMDGKIFGITLLCLKSLVTTSLSIFIFTQIMAIIDGNSGKSLDIEVSHILVLVTFVILGLLMWNSLLAGFAATIDDPNHSSRTMLMMLPAVPIFLAYSLADAPHSITMQVLSYIPFTSFAAIPIRMAETTIPTWEIVLSIGILIASTYIFRKGAARLFNMGVMMYGKEPSFVEMTRAILNKTGVH